MSTPDDQLTELQKLELLCQTIGGAIGDSLGSYTRHIKSPRIGFFLFMFDFDGEGWATFVSNAEREDLIQAIEEWVWRAKGIDAIAVPQQYQQTIAQLVSMLEELDFDAHWTAHPPDLEQRRDALLEAIAAGGGVLPKEAK